MKEEQENKEKDGNIQAKFAQWLSPFQITFVIFWVICNYDFLLILIGKKAILHDLYNHFGYGCGVVDFTDNNTISNTFKLNIFWCVEKGRWQYALYFAMWKVAIPFGLTVGYIRYYYPKFVTPLNLRYENVENDALRLFVKAEVGRIKEEEEQASEALEAMKKLTEEMKSFRVRNMRARLSRRR